MVTMNQMATRSSSGIKKRNRMTNYTSQDDAYISCKLLKGEKVV